MDHNNRTRIYLDNAATSWPKPERVLLEIQHFYRDLGVSVSRSGSIFAGQVERKIERCRKLAGQLLGASQDDCIVFGFNGTDVLNMALHGILRNGDRVVTSVTEHNSVRRPLEYLARTRDIQIDWIPCDSQGCVDLELIKLAIGRNPAVVAMNHVSNVTGVIQPLQEIGNLCRQADITFLVDAAQSVGHMPVSVVDLQCDLLAASGHKGLLGPLGTAILYLNQRILDQIQPLRQGGTGSDSVSAEQPQALPDRLESGNPNSGGIFGLLAGIEYVLEVGPDQIHDQETAWSADFVTAISDIPKVVTYGTSNPNRTGTVSFNIQDQDPSQIAGILDSSFNIQTRAGLHCAPLMHRALDTEHMGGTVRVSPGIFNSPQERHNLVEAIREITIRL